MYTQHFWMRWLDGLRNFFLNSEFCQAFDLVSHRIAIDKLKKVTAINPYIVNWVITCLKDRQQRVCVDNAIAPFLPVNRGVPQDTALGTVLFTIIIGSQLPDYLEN